VTDLKRKRGDAIRLAVGPVLKPDGTVQPLAGLTIRFTAKDKLDDADGAAVIAGSTNDGRVTLVGDGSTGEANVVIPASVTAGFATDRTLHWDLQVSDGAGTITATLDSGLLYVERDVTRASP